MILLDKPYVSDFLIETIRKNRFPVVKTRTSAQFMGCNGSVFIDEDAAIRQIKESGNTLIYTNSENAIGWIVENLPFSGLPDKISMFKDKVRFRTLMQCMHPDFFFREVRLEDLDTLDVRQLPMPFIIKPATGFFSMGVYKVSDPKEWEETKRAIREEMNKVRGLYPMEVLDTASLIVEQVIQGDEFAFDAYFNNHGDPVILSILNHVFASENDVGDRVYLTSKAVVEDNMDEFTGYLKTIAGITGVKNFPVHVEVRRDPQGRLIPIEINPMRFGGWCTTADLAHFAYGFNAYEYYFSQARPDWSRILENREGLIYSMIVLDNTTGYDESRIRSFDYDRLLSHFRRPLDLRKIDYQQYLVFGFLFAETLEDETEEIDRILRSDLREYVTLK